MKDTFEYESMQPWLVEELKKRNITRPSEILGRTEEELLDSGLFTLGTIRHLSLYFEERGQFFKYGESSLNRLHLHKPGLKMLRNKGIYNLDDLEYCTWSELAWKFGFGRERANYIEMMMRRLGRKLRD